MSENLTGKKVVVTRTRSQASALVALLEARGADVIEIPTIKILPPDDKQEFVEGVSQVHTYDWLVFTSPNGVERFFDAFYTAYADARSIGGLKIAAVGPSTAKKINEYRFATDLMPDTYVAEALVSTFAEKESVENLTMLWVRGNEARDVIQKGLSALGAIVDECIAYKTVAETEDPTGGKKRYSEEGADAVTFASSSAVEHFFKLGLTWKTGTKALSMGPVTTAALKAQGLDVTDILEASESSLEGIVDCL